MRASTQALALVFALAHQLQITIASPYSLPPHHVPPALSFTLFQKQM